MQLCSYSKVVGEFLVVGVPLGERDALSFIRN
jgi:hypothetical protein